MSFTIYDKVSIRLMSGGHSFSREDIDVLAGALNGNAVVEIITPRTTLVPTTMYHADATESYLRMVGRGHRHDEVVVVSPEVDDRVAIMAINKECYDYLRTTFGDNIHFVSPLILSRVPKEGAIIELVGEVMYVRIFNGGMIFGETIVIPTDADMLYALESINAVYHIYNMRTRVKGDVARFTKCCNDLFTNLECE